MEPRATITINMGNAAFNDPGELSRILRDIAYQASDITNNVPYRREWSVKDVNGNAVGSFEVH